MTIGIFQGRRKPSNVFDIYEQFIDNVIRIREQGRITVRGKLLPLNIRCFIADAPARAFVLNRKNHMSTNACLKCKFEGQYSIIQI